MKYLKVTLSLLLIFLIWESNLKAQLSYSFFVGGHAYGAHSGTNLGMHPPFLKKMAEELDPSVFAVFLTGDIINHSTSDSWSQVASELDELGIEAYYSMGNHDDNDIGYQVFNEKYGKTYYSLTHGNGLFIVLNSTIGDRQISAEQLEFIQNCLNSADTQIRYVYLFFHEILWNSLEKYRDVLSNSRSRYDQMRYRSNYWTDVQPLLEACDKQVFVFTGDVGGNEDAIALFYDRWDKVTLISSGMGEVADENFLRVDVSEDSLSIIPIPLRDGIELQSIETYSIPAMPDTIYGPTQLSGEAVQHQYSVPEENNATKYTWLLSDGMTGESSSSGILIDFDNDFEYGVLGVQAEHPGYGTSEMKTITITADQTSVNFNTTDKPKISWLQHDETIFVTAKNFIPGIYHLQMFDLKGHLVLGKNFSVNAPSTQINIDLATIPKGTYLISIFNESFQYSQKLIIE